MIAAVLLIAPCPPVKLGQKVATRGIRRHDDENGHKWEEVHPLEWWSWK